MIFYNIILRFVKFLFWVLVCSLLDNRIRCFEEGFFFVYFIRVL